ncbi:MAG: hypothetical protein JWM85_2752 [Acidimicrobiaceae bacterium]|nr:hypothetical protein [Acidimicrobiaceae bacterium]
MRLGVDSFSFHRWFGEVNHWESPIGQRWGIHDLLGYVEGLGIDVLSLQTIHFEDQNTTGLEMLRAELERIGVECIYAWGHRNGLEDGQSPAKLAQAIAAIQAASDLGCRIARIVCGDQNSWSDDPERRALQLAQLRGPISEICREAERLDVVVAVENHADRSIIDVIDLVSSAGSDYLGICLDVGNAARVSDDLVAAVESALPWVVMTHLRDLRIDSSQRDPENWWPCVALGEGDLDIPGVLGALARAPRCDTWLVEVSNVWPGRSELEIVDTSLDYLRAWLTHSTDPSRL